MVQIEDVKSLSHQVVESHNHRGFSLIKLIPGAFGSVGVLLNVTKNPWITNGRELKAKADVRKFLWDESKTAKMRRKARTFVWTRYIEAEDVSVMGLATLVNQGVAEKMARLDQSYHWIEVQR